MNQGRKDVVVASVLGGSNPPPYCEFLGRTYFGYSRKAGESQLSILHLTTRT